MHVHAGDKSQTAGSWEWRVPLLSPDPLVLSLIFIGFRRANLVYPGVFFRVDPRPFRVEAAPPGVFFCVDPFKATLIHVREHVRPLRWAMPWTHVVPARKGGRYGGVDESEHPSSSG